VWSVVCISHCLFQYIFLSVGAVCTDHILTESGFKVLSLCSETWVTYSLLKRFNNHHLMSDTLWVNESQLCGFLSFTQVVSILGWLLFIHLSSTYWALSMLLLSLFFFVASQGYWLSSWASLSAFLAVVDTFLSADSLSACVLFWASCQLLSCWHLLSLHSNSGLFRCYHCSLLLPEFCEYWFLWSWLSLK